MRRLRVYIAGPMTSSGSKIANYATGLSAEIALMENRFAPFTPHHSFITNTFNEFSWEEWLQFDETWIEVCDAILRIPGESKGAAREELYAALKGIPVFHSIDELIAYRKGLGTCVK